MNHGVLRRLSARLFGFAFAKHWHRRDVGGCVAALPVLRTQIQEAALDVERAVSSVCTNFQNIADRSSETVAKAAAMLGNQQEGGATVAQSVETSRTTISRLLDRMERAGRISSMAITRMDEIENAVQGMECLLAEVQKIAFTNKVIALNAKIEAVHVGAMGVGFEVVAEEITRQAERTNELTEGIAQRIEETRDRVHRAAGDLKEFVAEDRTESEASRNAAQAALQALFSVHQNACDSVEMMTSENSRLREEISHAVMNLQFQDRFGQRVAHVSEALQKIERVMGHPEDSAATARGSSNSLLEDVQAAYSMHDERVAHARIAGDAGHPAEDAMEVELF